MAIARSEDGSNVANSNVASNVRRRMVRKPIDAPGPPSHPAPAQTTSAPSQAAAGSATRLDDLYRLAMPKLFTLAEREGINEHTGMTRGQLIMGIVRRQIERGDPVRGSGTLAVPTDGYGFLPSVAHSYLASPGDIYVPP